MGDPERLRNGGGLAPGLRAALGQGGSRSLPPAVRQRMRDRLTGLTAFGAAASSTAWIGWAKALAAALGVAGASVVVVQVTERPREPMHAPPAVQSPRSEREETLAKVPTEPPAAAPEARALSEVHVPTSKSRPMTKRAFRSPQPPAPEQAPTAETSELGLAAETRMLSRAQAALDRAPEDALAATAAHAAGFPSGLLAAERELLAAEALLRLSRPQEAERRLRALIASQPGAIYTQRARRLLGTTSK